MPSVNAQRKAVSHHYFREVIFLYRLDGQLSRGNDLLSFLSPQLPSDECAQYKIFYKTVIAKGCLAPFHATFEFDKAFYKQLRQNGAAKVNINNGNLEFRIIYEENGCRWEIKANSSLFSQPLISWEDENFRLNIQQVVTIKPQSFKSVPKKRNTHKRKRKREQDNYYATPKEYLALYGNGWLYRHPSEKPTPLGRGTLKHTGGGKKINANYIGKMNQGGLFTPK